MVTVVQIVNPLKPLKYIVSNGKFYVIRIISQGKKLFKKMSEALPPGAQQTDL